MMVDPKKAQHFEGKEVATHLKAAREKGAKASSEIHGTEPPGHLSAGADSAKETALLLLIVLLLTLPIFGFSTNLLLFLGLFAFALFVWKVGRSASLGWARLERLHRLIEEERWEIEHHRAQEKEELIEMYRAKGFSGKLLDEVIDVLMADDNRLLQIMLEEELGLTLEAFEHPLKQASGAAIGVLASALLFGVGLFFGGFIGALIAGGITISLASFLAAKIERNNVTSAIVWNLAIAFVSTATLYFLIKWILPS